MNHINNRKSKTTKNAWLLVLLFLSGLTFPSCKKFLDQEPQSFIASNDFYKNADQMKQAVNGLYNVLRDLYKGGKTYGGFWLVGEMRSDNTTFQFNPADRGRSEHEKVDFFQLYPANPYVAEVWQGCYYGISQCNNVLDNIDKVKDFKNDEKSDVIGQAKFIRALFYFDLVRIYGGVPIRIEAITSPNQAYTKEGRSSAEEVYDQIIKDAGDASEKLPQEWSGNLIGKATKGAANTLLGLVYLTQKDYKNADKFFQKVIQSNIYGLIPDYSSLYEINNKNNKESIFEFQYSADEEGQYSNYLYFFAPFNSGRDVVGFSNIGDQAGRNIPTHDMVNAYEKNDLRKDASIAWYENPENTQYPVAFGDSIPYIKKYATPPSQQGRQSVDLYLYRYAQVLLWEAEVLNELGDRMNLAYQYLNKIRNRAGLGNLSGLSQEEFRRVVYHEERIEGAFENHRWFQLLRTGKAIEVMTKMGKYMKQHHPNITSDDYDIQPYKLLFPIPRDEVRLNKLDQNPGW